MTDFLKNKVILITGGTGSFGKACIEYILLHHQPKSIRIYSRDELKQWEMMQTFKAKPQSEKLRFFIGDVRDRERLKRATEGVNFIIHAAALKQVPSCEYNPIEAIRTNIDGAINVIDAALDNNVEKVIALSTDKASQPINLYGATKLCSDKLFIQSNNYTGPRKTRFTVVRYGNVMGSRGSVIPLFKKQSQDGEITITHRDMTRFWITLEQAVKFVLTSFEIMHGGELFVPKIPSMKIIDLANAIAPNSKIKDIGIRPGEKIHESLISKEESSYTYDLGNRYLIVSPTLGLLENIESIYTQIKIVSDNFEYNSKDNTDYLAKEDLLRLIENFE